MVRPVDTTFRPAAVNDVVVPGKGGSMVRRAVRACIALLLATCIGVAAVAWRSYGDTARKQIVKLTTQLALISWLPEKPGFAAQPAAPAVQADTANAASPQPAAPAQSAAEAVPPAAAPSSDSAKSLLAMTRDLASLGQEVEQLKASIEQLRASQQQISRDAAKASEVKASEQNLRARISALPPRPAATRARKPLPSYPPQQALTAPVLPEAAAPYVTRQPEPQPQAPVQSLTDPELSSVPRPPMPVR
jgi:small-conductance mechanosensitive channel